MIYEVGLLILGIIIGNEIGWIRSQYRDRLVPYFWLKKRFARETKQ